MKDKTKFLIDFVKPKADRHFFSFALRFYLVYKAPTSEEKEERASITECSSKAGSKSKKSEMVELWPAFEIEKDTLHCILAVGKHQQTTAANRAAHTLVVDLANLFWRLEASKMKLIDHENFTNNRKIVNNHPR